MNKVFSDIKTKSFILSGEKIYLRDVSVDHLMELKEWITIEPEEMMTCRPVVKKSKEDNLKSYEESIKRLTSHDFGIYEINTNLLAGKVSCFDFNFRNCSAEIGYFLIPEFRNKGYTKEALKLMLKLLFEFEDVNKLYAQTGSFNLASIKLLESLNFKLDAKLREHHKYNEVYYDDYIYSILKSEFLNK